VSVAESTSIYAALLAARMKMEAPKKSAKNPHFGNAYAPLDELVAVSFAALAAEGLLLSQHTRVKDGRTLLETRILSATDSLDCGDYDLGPLTTPQAMGSAITYARRYTIAAILGLAAEEDDDGNAGSEKPASKPAAKPAAPKKAITSDRAALEADYIAAWKGTRTTTQAADPDDWKNRGSAVKAILNSPRFVKVSDMTDEQLRACIAEWTGGDSPPPMTDEDVEKLGF
jgi:hypothetical protein